MTILGLNAYHGDSSACILLDGQLVAAAEEERFRRIKHWAGFPTMAISYCLLEAKVAITEVDYIAVNRDPSANIVKKAIYAFRKRPSYRLVKERLVNATQVRDIKETIAEEMGVDDNLLKCKVCNVEHHQAHLGSSYFVSPFDEAAVVSVDGFGDFVGAMWGYGKGNKMEVKERIYFPHSLGLFYLAITQLLGFPKYGDEYKVMGLASYGKPEQLPKMRQIVLLEKGGLFKLNLDQFIHHSKGVTMTWESGEPVMGPAYSKAMEDLLCPTRKAKDPIERKHEDIAASLQAMYEEALFHVLNHVFIQCGTKRLCLAGGCAMNSVANGKIFDKTPFRDVYIQAAAGDAGGAVGAGFYVWNQILGKKRKFVMETAYWGPGYGETQIRSAVEGRESELKELGCSVKKIDEKVQLCKAAAEKIAEGKVVGWFQGRMEWGPRALGNRSIIVDPRRAEMKDVLNSRIKRREPFRPFAPSILLEKAGEYFERDYPDPFMLKVYPVRPGKRAVIPAVTHVDGTGRLQTVRKEDNPLYWQLIKEFENLTGVPVVLNTSFNENEPIVNTPDQALDCFLRTKMDVLVLGSLMISRI